MSEIQFRWLTPFEWDRITEIFEREKWAIPHPNVSAIRIGEVNGEIVALGVVQAIPFIGPAWIAPEYRGQGLTKEEVWTLYEQAKQAGPYNGVMITTTLPQVERIAEMLEMTKVDGVLYQKEF